MSNIDYNNLDWSAPRYTQETVNHKVEVRFALDRPNIWVVFHEEGKPIEVHAVCPPDKAGEAVVYEKDLHYDTIAFVDVYEAGPVLRVETPKGSFFLAHSRGRVVTYTT